MAEKIAIGVMALSADAVTPAFGVSELTNGAVEFVWTGVTAFDASVIVEAAIAPEGAWNTVGGASMANLGRAILDSAADAQTWTVKIWPSKFVRLSYTSNSNTTGTATFKFFGNIR